MLTLGILDMDPSPLMVVFWASEMLVHVFGFVVSTVFLVTFFKFPLFHLNFRAIVADLTVCCFFTSVCRFAILVGKIAELFPQDSEFGDWLQIFRDTGMYAAGFHLVLLSGERAIATIKSRVYEKTRGLHWVILVVLFTWSASFLIVLPTRRGNLTQYVAVGIIAGADSVALVVMFCFFYASNRMYHRVASESNAHSLSQRYQFSENLNSSRVLKRLLMFLAGASVIALLSFLGYVVCGNLTTPGRISGFIFDVTIASLTAFVPIIIIFGNPRLRTTTFDRICPQTIRASNGNAAIPTDINGNRLIVENETKVYFDQLRTSWK